MTGQAHKTRVAVVFGGRSAEHAISCVSAGSVLAALDPRLRLLRSDPRFQMLFERLRS